MLAGLASVKAKLHENSNGSYVDIEGRFGEPLALDSLNASGLNLLQFRASNGNTAEHATVFATKKGLLNLEKKISEFQNKPIKIKEDGTYGQPIHAKLVQGIQAITEAALKSLWRSDESRFPAAGITTQWEVWLWPRAEADFRNAALQAGIHLSADSIKFPEDTIVVATCNQEQLAQLVSGRGEVKALAVLASLPSFFDDLPPEDQSDWVNGMTANTQYEFGDNPSYVTLLDTGVSRAHPLLMPVVDQADRHRANPEWTVEDNLGHGTQMAGLAIYGDMTIPLQTPHPVAVTHRLESVKIYPDAGENQHYLLGATTENAVAFVEATGARRRVFSLASSTDQDTPHDGAPTSWSAALDKICFNPTGNDHGKRLLVVSAGNTDQNKFSDIDYLQVCDSPDHELESPAQAWNGITVGAFTEKSTLTDESDGVAYAPVGDLSPSSRTSSWNSTWPLKPDVVLEGGNWCYSGFFPPLTHQDLQVLTTHHTYPQRAFCTVGQTSAATSLASRQLAMLWNEYPYLWPETIRALYVSSARWTNQMLAHLPASANKGNYEKLFKRYGYGVPDFARATKSASNSLTLIVQDFIVPYARSPKDGAKNIVNNELKLFSLPWPELALRALGNTYVTLRVALSSFIEPNPSEASRGRKYLYASHNLRFKLNRANENAAQFLSRISNEADKEEDDQIADESEDGWLFGVNRRDVGSLHIDELKPCNASDLARRNLIAVHPVAGWWKSPKVIGSDAKKVRFSLIVEIIADSVDTDIYAEVANAIAIQVEIEN